MMFKMVMGLANKDSKRINTNSFEIVLESLIDENRSLVTIDVHIYLPTPAQIPLLPDVVSALLALESKINSLTVYLTLPCDRWREPLLVIRSMQRLSLKPSVQVL